MPRILVVDDNAEYRTALANALSAAGYEIIEAQSGHNVPEICHAQRIDLVITDIVMPEYDGFEVIMAMKRSRSAIPIIAISGVSQHDSYLRAAERMGATAAVSKEAPTAALIQKIRELLSNDHVGR